jgi:hypothetical protein
MLYFSTKLFNAPLLSIRSGSRVGTALEPIINPHNLHIDGFYCQVSYSKTPLVLLDIQIRDYSVKGIIIDDHNNLSPPDELPRLKSVLEINFKLPGKTVEAGGKKIGKVAEFAVDSSSWFIQKLYVNPNIWQGINQHRLTIDRSSVIEVTDTKIVVKGPEEKVSAEAQAKPITMPATYSASTSLIKE